LFFFLSLFPLFFSFLFFPLLGSKKKEHDDRAL